MPVAKKSKEIKESEKVLVAEVQETVSTPTPLKVEEVVVEKKEKKVLKKTQTKESESEETAKVPKVVKKTKKILAIVDEPEEPEEPVPVIQSVKIDPFPESGPNVLISLPDFVTILMSHYIPHHKYVGLQVIENDVVVPMFFTVLEDWSADKKLKCQVVKHQNTTDSESRIHCTPLWDDPWIVTDFYSDFIWNCMPFDGSRDYVYDP